MQGNNFVTKMTGRGELPIEKLQGFQSPDEETHEYILQKIKDRLSRERLSSLLWIFISAAFICLYVYLIIKSNTETKGYLVLSAIVFVIIALVCMYKMIFVDAEIKKSVENQRYRIREVNIHHLMPGFGISLGKAIAKISDEKKNVYSYEFSLSKQLRKIYKKNPNELFTIIELEMDVKPLRKNKTKKIYSITCIPKEELEEENEDMEDVEK